LWHAIDHYTVKVLTSRMHDLVIGLFVNRYEFRHTI